MLSNSDIKKEIGTNILIYPFKLENIRGSSLNLTASRLAWSLSSKKSIVQDNKIVISPNDTALIETEECLYVSSNISGTYHSKVSLVSEGLGHISTLLDPEWIGNSLIAVHNLTTSTIEIEIGKTFVSLCFYYLRTNSTYADNANTPGRPQILLNNGIVLSKEENEIMGEDWRSNKKDLKKKLLDSEQYKSLLDLKDKKIVTRRNFVSYILPHCCPIVLAP